jgi:hypothetical protein
MRRARSAAGRPSTRRRRSANASRTRTVVPIWKSAALGSSPPIVPSATSASTRAIRSGSAARSPRTVSSRVGHGCQLARHLCVGGRHEARQRQADHVGRDPAPHVPVPGGAPAENAAGNRLKRLLPPVLGRLDCPALLRISREERRLRDELVEEAGYLGGALNPAAVDAQRGHRDSAESDQAHHDRLGTREDVHQLVLDALALQHEPGRLGGVGEREEVEPRRQAQLASIFPSAIATAASQ